MINLIFRECTNVKYFIVITTPVAVVLMALSNFILLVWVGPKFMIASAPLQLLAIGYFFNTITIAPSTVLYGIGRPDITAKIAVVATFMNLALGLTLIPRWGLIGASIMILVPQLIITPVYVWYTRNVIGAQLRFSSYIPQTLISSILVGLMMITIPHDTFISLVTTIVISGIVYLATILILGGLDLEDKQMIWGILRSLINRWYAYEF